jgi:hypothetical protein
MKGEVTLILKKKGIVTKLITKTNLVVRNYYEGLLNWSNTNTGASISIITSTNTDPPNFDIPPFTSLSDQVYGNMAPPLWVDSVYPPFIQFQAQYPPPGFSNTFQTVGLDLGGSIQAYLVLDTPCTQEEDEFLDIFYRLQFDNIGNTVSDRVVADFGRQLVTNNIFSSSYLSNYYIGSLPANIVDNYEFPSVPFSANLIQNDSNSFSEPKWDSGSQVSSHFKFKMVKDYDIFSSVGIILNQILIGANTEELFAYSLFRTSNPTPIQSLFSHASNSVGPFFNSLTTAVGSGSLTLSGSPTVGIPDLYRIEITASGNNGTAQYKFSRRKWVGFNGNTYENIVVHCPYFVIPDPFTGNINNPPVASFKGWKPEHQKIKFNERKIIQFEETGLTLLDVLDGSYKNYVIGSQIRQVAVSGNLVFAACRNNGLYQINVVTDVISTVVNSPCFGVDVGRNNVIFAVVSTGIVNSSNGYSTSDPLDIPVKSNVLYIKADPEDPLDKLAVVAIDGGINRIYWWQRSPNLTTPGYTNSDVPSYASGLDVSDTGSVWCFLGGTIDYGSDFVLAGGQFHVTSSSINSSLYGFTLFAQVNFLDDLIFGFDGLYDRDGNQMVVYENIATQHLSPFCVHLGEGIFILQSGITCIWSNDNAWAEYGWNGTQWIKGSSATKATHATAQLLDNNISVAFDDGTGLSWFASDYYTFAVADGLVKDNSTTFYLEHNWYSAPATRANINAIIPPSLSFIIPEAASFDFITLEVDSPETHSLLIAGNPVTLIRNDNTAPAPNEITIYPSGEMIFNAADVGKNLTGNYLYVRI